MYIVTLYPAAKVQWPRHLFVFYYRLWIVYRLWNSLHIRRHLWESFADGRQRFRINTLMHPFGMPSPFRLMSRLQSTLVKRGAPRIATPPRGADA